MPPTAGALSIVCNDYPTRRLVQLIWDPSFQNVNDVLEGYDMDQCCEYRLPVLRILYDLKALETS